MVFKLKILILTYVYVTSIQGSPLMSKRGNSLITKEQYCSNLLHFNNKYYTLEGQNNFTGMPADMKVQWKTGKMFFVFISEDMSMSLKVLKANGAIETINTRGLGQSSVVDNANNIVYLATDNGVYKYNADKTTELYVASGEDVMYVAVGDQGTTMYIATWPQNRVHKITNNGTKQEIFLSIPNGHSLTVDTNNNIYFVASLTTYVLKNGETIPIKISGLSDEKITSGIFVSKSGDVYVMNQNSDFYILDPVNASARYLGSFTVNGVNSFAMDAFDNVIIGVKDSLLKFIAHNKNPCQ